MVQTIDTDRFVERVSELIGAASTESAARAILATLKAVGEALLPNEARSLARAFPPLLSEVIMNAPHVGRLSAEGLVARVTLHEGVAPGFAREHSQSVLRALGELLPGEPLTHLERDLAPEVAQLLRPHDEPEAPPHSPRTARHTLSEGKLAAQHSIAEAGLDTAHVHSVARSGNPHADTKLSSSHGVTQEALEESLATGHPSERPISTGRK